MAKTTYDLMDDFDFDITQENLDFELEAMAMEADSNSDKDDKDADAGDIGADSETEEMALANAAMMDLTTEDDIHEISESTQDMREASEIFGVAMEKTIVRFDRKSRYNHLNKQAQLNLAKQNNDPNYKKLLKVWEMERALEKKIAQRWGSKATSIANVKIRDYSSNGKKKMAKPNSSTVAYKGKVSNRIAQRAVSQSKRMFSNTNKKTAGK